MILWLKEYFYYKKTLGWINGWRYFRLNNYCKKHPGMMQYFADCFEHQGEISLAEGDIKYGNICLVFAEALREGYRKYEQKYIEAPAPLIYKGKSLFLAGSISNAENWQIKAAKAFLPYINVINPRRSTPFTPEMDEEQISWEFKALEAANIIFFYFSCETVAPITLYELGAAMHRNNNTIYICSHPDYPRLKDIIIQCRLMGYAVTIGLDKGIRHVINRIKE